MATAVQVSGQSTMSVQGGVIHSALTNSADGEADLGIHGQVTLTRPFTTGPLGLRVATAFTQRGATFRVGGVTSRGRASMNYLQLPLLLTLNAGSQSPVAVHGFGGVSPSFMVNCHYEFPGYISSDTCDEGVYIKRTYVEWLVGAGITVRSGNRAIVLDALFNQGLSAIYESGGRVKTRAITLLAGVELALHGAHTP
jgi:hypothetical protein